MGNPNAEIFKIATSIHTPIGLAGLFGAFIFYIFYRRLDKERSSKNRKTVIVVLFVLSLVAMILGFLGYILVRQNSLKFVVYIDGVPAKQLTVKILNADASAIANENGQVAFEIYNSSSLEDLDIQFKYSDMQTGFDTVISKDEVPMRFYLKKAQFKKIEDPVNKVLKFNLYEKNTRSPLKNVEVSITNIGIAKSSDRDGIVTISYSNDFTVDSLDMLFKCENPKIDTSFRVSTKGFPTSFILPISNTRTFTTKDSTPTKKTVAVKSCDSCDHIKQGNSEFDKANYEEALKYYTFDTMAPAIRRRHEALLNSARCHIELGNKDKANLLLHKIIDEGEPFVNPAKNLLTPVKNNDVNNEAYDNIKQGNSEFDRANYEGALKYYALDTAAQAIRRRHEALLNSARCHIELGNKEKAKLLLHKIIDEGDPFVNPAKNLMVKYGW